MEAQFKVSVKTDSSEMAKRLVITFNFESPDHLLRTYDFLPKTNTVTDKGEITVKQSSEASVGAKVLLAGSADATGKAGIEVLRSWSELPDRRVQVASGTINNEHGVFFKLNPTTQHTVEGQHTFVWFFEAPIEWRCDYVRLVCSSKATGLYSVRDEDNKFAVGLFSETDNAAKKVVEDAQLGNQRVASLRKDYASIFTSVSYGLFGIGRSRLEALQQEIDSAEQDYDAAVHAIRSFKAER
jgi:hypothetical protein